MVPVKPRPFYFIYLLDFILFLMLLFGGRGDQNHSIMLHALLAFPLMLCNDSI
jgi:hypothetical protein